MGLLRLLGLETDQALVDENAKLKTDNLTLISRVGVLESHVKSEKEQTAVYLKGYEEGKAKITQLASEICELTDAVELLKDKLKKKRRKAKKSK